MRQREPITSSLSVPLAMSCVVLVVLLALATTPTAIHLHKSPASTSEQRGIPTVTDSALRSNRVDTQHPQANSTTTHASRGTSGLPPESVTPIVDVSLASGTLSGGDTSMSLQPLSGPHTVRWESDQPLEVTVWDGACTVDTLHHLVTNATTTPCTLELHSATFTTWQLFELA